MTDPKPTHPWMPLQIFAGVRPRVRPCIPCMNFTLRPSPARFSRPQGHEDSESVISTSDLKPRLLEIELAYHAVHHLVRDLALVSQAHERIALRRQHALHHLLVG